MITPNGLQQSHEALSSLLSKCEKAVTKLTNGTSQHTLMTRRISALKIAIQLIEEKLK